MRHLASLWGKFGKGGGKHFLAYPEHILLGGKAHFKIQLVELPGGAVCPGVLIAETGGNLEILIKAGYHQQLLVLLRRLGQGIKFALVFAGRHNVISGALRG